MELSIIRTLSNPIILEFGKNKMLCEHHHRLIASGSVTPKTTLRFTNSAKQESICALSGIF